MRACVGVNNREIEIEEDGREVARTIPMYPAIWDWGTKLETATVENEDGEGEGKEQDSVSAVGDKSVGFDIALGADLVRFPFVSPRLPTGMNKKDESQEGSVWLFCFAPTNENPPTLTDLRRRYNPTTYIDSTGSFRELPYQAIYHCGDIKE